MGDNREVNDLHSTCVENIRTRASMPQPIKYMKLPTYCEDCEIELHYVEKYEMHCQMEHTGGKVFFCQSCPSGKERGFVSVNGLRRHVKKRHAFTPKIWNIQRCCEWCVVNFPSASLRDLETHFKEEHGFNIVELPTFCEPCQREFYFVHDYEEHNASKHENSPIFFCDLCPPLERAEFSKITDLKHHTYKKHGDVDRVLGLKKLYCKPCDMRFNRLRQMEVHFSKFHNKEHIFFCEICHRGYSYKRGLLKHVNSVHKATNFNCEYCGKVIAGMRTLKRHEFTCDKRLNCKDPEEKLQSFWKEIIMNDFPDNFQELLGSEIADRNSNLITATEGNVKNNGSEASKEKNTLDPAKILRLPTFCGPCNREFYYARDYEAHNAAKHNNSPIFFCHLCPPLETPGFSTVKDLINHATRENHKVDVHCYRYTNLHCKTCNVRFDRLNNMEKHFVNVHNRKREFFCDICNEGFVFKREVKRHVLKLHRVYKFKCEYCDETFDNIKMRNAHAKVCNKKLDVYHALRVEDNVTEDRRDHASWHSKLRKKSQLEEMEKAIPVPFDPSNLYCPSCDVHFNDLQTTENHFIERHKRIPAYICPKCVKGFAFNSSCVKHINEIHNFDKCIYACKYCPVTFRRKCHFRSHEKACKIKADMLDKLPNLMGTSEWEKKSKWGYFYCEYCKKNVILLRKTIRQHLKSHLNSHMCPVCKRGFRHSRNADLLVEHVRKHHRDYFESTFKNQITPVTGSGEEGNLRVLSDKNSEGVTLD